MTSEELDRIADEVALKSGPFPSLIGMHSGDITELIAAARTASRLRVKADTYRTELDALQATCFDLLAQIEVLKGNVLAAHDTEVAGR